MTGRLDEDGDDLAETHEINVTPFIDVMLVLLIIFMVAAPLSNVSVPVDLPESNAVAQPRQETPVSVTLSADLVVSLGEKAVDRDRIGPALDAATGGDRDERIFLRADSAVAYGDVMDLMNLLRSAGYLKVALVGVEEGTGK
jgi:biopolymer transport protein ExbD